MSILREGSIHGPTAGLEKLPLFMLQIELTSFPEKLLSNGDKWEPELAAAIRADAPYR